MRALGHRVYRPTLTGLGERSHLLYLRPTLATFIDDILQVIRYEDLDDVILVGHSFGGLTVSGVVDRIGPAIRHLVFLDAQVCEPGQSSAGDAGSSPYRATATGTDAKADAVPKDPEYFGIADPVVADWLRSKLTPQPLALFEEKLRLDNPVGNGRPTTYIACTHPYLNSIRAARERARDRSDWTYLEMDAPHDVMLTDPEATANLLASIG
jgi:pimeloyl-ACP methyl ester carboxylesterase